MKKEMMDVRKITWIGFGIALNVVGAFIAMTLGLPIYLDSIGTIMIAVLLGPKYGIITGVCGSITSGMTFDMYSFYFAPVQISTGLLAGIMHQRGVLKGKKTPLGVLIFILPTALMSAVITAKLFGGVTSAGSSYIVQMCMAMGLPDVTSVFIIQIITDYADKYVALILVLAGMKIIPRQFKPLVNTKVIKGD